MACFEPEPNSTYSRRTTETNGDTFGAQATSQFYKRVNVVNGHWSDVTCGQDLLANQSPRD